MNVAADPPQLGHLSLKDPEVESRLPQVVAEGAQLFGVGQMETVSGLLEPEGKKATQRWALGHSGNPRHQCIRACRAVDNHQKRMSPPFLEGIDSLKSLVCDTILRGDVAPFDGCSWRKPKRERKRRGKRSSGAKRFEQFEANCLARLLSPRLWQ